MGNWWYERIITFLYDPPASREGNYRPVNKPVSSGKARSFPNLPWLPEHAWPVASLVQMPIKGEVRTLCPKLGFRASTGHSHDSVCTFLFTPCPFGSLRSHSLELYLPWKELQEGSPPKTLQFCRQVCKLCKLWAQPNHPGCTVFTPLRSPKAGFRLSTCRHRLWRITEVLRKLQPQVFWVLPVFVETEPRTLWANWLVPDHHASFQLWGQELFHSVNAKTYKDLLKV